jgi:uncharacterized protein
MNAAHALVGVLIGLVSGILAGLFGVGGGIVMTPGIQALLGAPPIVSLATPLPAIFPTALTGAYTYARAGEVDVRAAAWMVGPGVAGAVVGSWLTDVVNTRILLVVTAALLALQAVGILRGRDRRERSSTGHRESPAVFAAIGAVAGFISGLLGIGGGTILVPALAGMIGMPLKRALGTSLLTLAVLVIPGTIVHAALGHIDWAIFLAVTLGAVPGVRIGARFALGTKERTLRTLVGGFLLVLSLTYGTTQLIAIHQGR